MKHTTIIVAVGLALATVLSATSAQALSGRSFISSQGSDANNCSLATPCRHLQTALAATAPGGEIAILDTAGYNGDAQVTIDKAISIVNSGGSEAGLTFLTSGIAIVINAGPNDAVSLRGLTIEGGGVGTTGIQFNSGKSLTIENCVIRHLTDDGIDFLPSAEGRLSVSNTMASDNGNTGIAVVPTGSVIVKAVFNRVETNNNTNFGILVDGETSTGFINATTYDSIAAGNATTGYYVATTSGHASTTLTLFHSVAANNGVGIKQVGSASTLYVAQSVVTGNGTGFWASGSMFSYGDNYMLGNDQNINLGALISVSKN